MLSTALKHSSESPEEKHGAACNPRQETPTHHSWKGVNEERFMLLPIFHKPLTERKKVARSQPFWAWTYVVLIHILISVRIHRITFGGPHLHRMLWIGTGQLERASWKRRRLDTSLQKWQVLGDLRLLIFMLQVALIHAHASLHDPAICSEVVCLHLEVRMFLQYLTHTHTHTHKCRPCQDVARQWSRPRTSRPDDIKQLLYMGRLRYRGYSSHWQHSHFCELVAATSTNFGDES